ncbi:MAG: hypothetical protein M3Y89_15395 [Actinomycetota bacterium]|nr:hypothetical protein [Actinomycetota bacterium]
MALLVLGLISTNSGLVVASIVVSLVAVVAIVRARQRRIERRAAEDAEAARLARIEADKDETTRVLAAAAAAASRTAAAAQPEMVDSAPADPAPAAPAPVDPAPVELAAEPSAEPGVADSEPPLTEHGDKPVWVIDGRPRYHAWSCDFIRGQASESVPLTQAVEDGFTPCAQCDPDRQLAGIR